MKTKMKRVLMLGIAVMTILGGTISAQAAGKYHEDQPLTSRKKVTLSVGTGHSHSYIDASNGCRYQLYHSCMDGMVGSVPTNHESTVTIDGIKYSLRNYGYKGKSCSYASVIKKIGTSGSSTSGSKTGSSSSGSKTGSSTSGSKTGSSSSASKKVPLKSIKLNIKSKTLKEKETLKLTVSFNPTNTTDSKAVTWKSSNSAVASVSYGKVTAKKAGTAVITAKVGKFSASCTISVNKPASAKTNNGTYKNVSQAYTLLNQFRANKSNLWYWNMDNRTKTTIRSLGSVKRDAVLEKVAKARAKEQWEVYYVKHKATHDRLNGSKCWTAYPAGSNPCAENLAWGQTTCQQMILDPNYGWAETNKDYAHQGHRRNMLKSDAKRVGIACYVKDGKTCWAMCLGF